jgi:PKD repeat protein
MQNRKKILVRLAFLSDLLKIASLSIKRILQKSNGFTMNTCTTAILLALFPFFSFAQTSISGIVNHYAQITEIDYCEGKLKVTTATAFAVGDKVLLIQMKGAQINASNSGSFGNIEELGAAGLFEKNEIIAKNGNELILKNALLNTYGTAGSVQLVSIPVYQNATVDSALTASPWDGQKGGVLILEVENELILNANIDVSGAGFRGGIVNVVNSGCTFLTNADAYYYEAGNWRGSRKGEGIAEVISNKELGRGAQANGGGGGNDHNAGGGGGSNIANAGEGGKQKSDSAFGCDGDYPGKGGKALPGEAARIFLGGGGGAGHTDDNGAGSSGGNGGGIAIILAGKIIGNGKSILANGKTPPQSGGDGAGGGGAGGTIYLGTATLEGDLNIEAKGGNGGKVSNSSTRCFGPGGGGSGGRIITGLSNPGTITLTGGLAGENTVPSNQCNGLSNGATAGQPGIQSAATPIPASANPVVEVQALTQPVPALGCEGQQVSFEFIVQGANLTYQWQVNNGTGWVNLTNSSNYSGTKTSILTLFMPVPALNGYQYRCVVNSPCVTGLFSEPATLTMAPAPQANFSFASLGGGTFEFTNASMFADTFEWDFGDGNTSSEENPTHTYTDFGTYTATLTVTGDCGTDVFTLQIIVTTAPNAGFTVDTQTGCVPLTVQFMDESSGNTESWQWFFPGGNPATSNEQNPVVTYSQKGTYAVTLVVSNVEGTDTLTMTEAVIAKDVPSVNFNFVITDLTVSFTNLSQNAAGGYVWDFGDGDTSTAINPTHEYPVQGFFEVTLTALNSCGEATLTQTISTGDLPLALFSANSEGGCTPLTIHFQNESSDNVTGYSWIFPGGEPAVSTEENPVVTYPEPGVYDVTLTVTNDLGGNTLTKPGLVVVEQTPMADFYFEIDSLTVNFTNLSDGGSYFIWNFDDGNSSNLENPVHTYTSNGVYTVTLTAANTACGSAIAYQVFINTTDTDEELHLPSAMIYPNPVREFLYVKLAEWPAGRVGLRLWDSQGRLIRFLTLENELTVLPVDELGSGIYFLELNAGSESARFKLVKLK